MDERVKRDFLEPRVLARLSALPLHARMPMLGSVSGRHRSPVRGSSLEFATYRKYVPGDDTRRLDWRAYGRSDRFYIKEFEADTNLRICLVVDASGSMRFGDGEMSKLDYARRLAGTLAYLASVQGDAVGLYAASDKFHTEIPSKRNAAHLRNILDELGRLEAGGETGLADVLHEVAERIPQRALIVIVSDLFMPPASLKPAFQHLRFRKHDVAVFHLLEQREIDFDFDRPTRFVDLEGHDVVMADPVLIGKQYREAISNYLSELTTMVREAAVDYHRVSLQDSYDQVLARFLLARMPKGAKS